ncbi:MAG TPA: N,N-dimethylformamidase beta subunit family domain-containing protein [Ktedonobacterales bacterium]|nr:N,N-dimethylformamidase beta subunit family domain-containing protein [Ktedonobacterales bacterium]
MKYLLVLCALVLLTSCNTPVLFQSPQPSFSSGPPSAPAPPESNIIMLENAWPGTTAWMVTTPGYSTQIQAYASATSVSAGQTLTFYASTAQRGAPYTVQIFRLGWYGGAGGRLLWSASETGQAQGVYDRPHQRLIGCTTCTIDPVTHLVQANWQPSFRVTIPADWVTGRYEAKFTNSAGKQAVVPFVVRGSATSTVSCHARRQYLRSLQRLGRL